MVPQGLGYGQHVGSEEGGSRRSLENAVVDPAESGCRFGLFNNEPLDADVYDTERDNSYRDPQPTPSKRSPDVRSHSASSSQE